MYSISRESKDVKNMFFQSKYALQDLAALEIENENNNY